MAAVISPASRSQEMQRGDLEIWRMVQTRSGTRSGLYRFKMPQQPLTCGFMEQFTQPGGTR
jgi:hypothetical protein